MGPGAGVGRGSSGVAGGCDVVGAEFCEVEVAVVALFGAVVVGTVVAAGPELSEPVSRVGRGVVTSQGRVPDSLCTRWTFNVPADVGTVTVAAFGPSAGAVVVCVGPVIATAMAGRAARKFGVSAPSGTSAASAEAQASSRAA